MNYRLFPIVTVYSILVACGPVAPSSNNRLMDGQGAPAPLFADDSVIAAKLVGPIRQVFEEKQSFVAFDADNGEWQQPYRKGTLQFGDSIIPASIRARGQGTRLGCAFPPLKIKLKSSDTAGTLLSGTRAFKTISHCDRDAAVSAKYRREGALYKLVKAIFPNTLETRLLEIHYVDPVGGIDEIHRAPALEDVKDAAKRLGLDPVDLDHSIYTTPWYAWDTTEVSTALEAVVGKEIMINKYQSLQRENPHSSKEDLSALLRQYLAEHGADLQTEVRAKAASRLHSFEIDTKLLQQDYLRRTDKSTAMRLILFNIMIGNSDWNHFGLNPMATHYAMRNVQIFKDSSGTVFPSPYDFDLSRIVSGHVSSSQDFTNSLNAYWTANAVSLSDYFQHFDQEAEKNRFLSKRQDLLDMISHLPIDPMDKEIFETTLSAFFNALQGFSFPNRR